MPIPLKIALLLHLVCLWAKEAVPISAAYLPLGGSHIIEFALLVMAAIIIIEIQELITKRKQ